ncbi:TRAP transporter small permease [Lachnoclostridium pacaense]|uniref:TRAP transporter small permease n=1 Tax=Enterocloster hominis (ex Hitch et al. 2024) TaxID=1917870 RepID=UPI001D129545|nr:TRAP transporter small permease [Lachnoclostridium pacaense]MCC2876267.1 TRAP transporter small permease [Lachnoclostridium pacaense]
MEKMKKLFDRVLEASCIALMSVMTILVSYQVITRYIFNKPSAVSEVLARYMFVWMVLLCAAYVFGLREHMNIPFVKDKLPPRGRIVCDIIGEVIIALFGLGVMVSGGYAGAMRQMGQLDSALQISMGIIYAAIPLSGISIVFYFFYNVSKLLKEFKYTVCGKEEA